MKGLVLIVCRVPLGQIEVRQTELGQMVREAIRYGPVRNGQADF